MTDEKPRLSKTREALERALAELEDAYKLTFLGIDRIVWHALAGDPEAEFKFTFSNGGATWAAPMKFARAQEVVVTTNMHMVSATYIAVCGLVEGYLRLMCLKLMTAAPTDSTWFSFDRLDTLSGVTNVDETSRYKAIVAMFQFREASFSGDVSRPRLTVTHDAVLQCFAAVKAFAEDFEAAFMLANANVKEEDI